MHNKMPLISVVIPIYNTEKYLEQCLDSVIKQTYSNLEIILVNDGSTDNSRIICERYKKRDNRIILINKQNQGLVSARKTGLQQSTGLYISYVDSDDWIDENMYMEMFRQGIILNADMICAGNIREFQDGSRLIEKPKIDCGFYERNEIINKVFPMLIKTDVFFDWGISLALWSYLFKKDLLLEPQKRVPDYIKMGEDVACCIPCYLKANSLYVTDEAFYHYRQISTSMKKTVKRQDRAGCKELFHYLRDYTCGCDIHIKNMMKKLVYITFFELLCSDYELFANERILFPYNVERKSRIILYGAGAFGNKMYSYLAKTNFCDIVLWVDTRYEMYGSEGTDVKNPVLINAVDYDYVVLASVKSDYRETIKNNLIKMGVDINKIADIDCGLLNEENLAMVLKKI